MIGASFALLYVSYVLRTPYRTFVRGTMEDSGVEGQDGVVVAETGDDFHQRGMEVSKIGLLE